MTKEVLYRYMGTNGVLETPIHLEDIYYIRRINLVAGPNKLLSDGTRKVKSVNVAEEEVERWFEVEDDLV